MKPAGVQAASCTIRGPSVVFVFLSSDLPFSGPRLLEDSAHTYSERNLTTVAEWGLQKYLRGKKRMKYSLSQVIQWVYIEASQMLNPIFTE